MAGHVLTSTDPNANQSNFSYNALGQPLSASFPATFSGNVQQTPAETVSYTYGANGRTSSVTDNRGTTSLAYENGCDRVQSVTDPVTGTLSYTYGLAGQRLTLSLPGGGTWTYGYAAGAVPGALAYCRPKDDPNSLAPMLANITDDQGRRLEVYVDIAGALHESVSNQLFDTATPPNRVAYQDTFLTFDSDAGGQNTHRWLTQTANIYAFKVGQVWQSKLLVQNNYAYDAAGQRLSNLISSLDGNGNPVSRTEAYGYDQLNRLTSVNYGDGQTQSYTFDQMGNRLSKTDTGGGIGGTENYTVNAANMLLTRGSNAYTNDANGNTLTGGGRTNTWDSQNRMTKCMMGANTSTFTYGSDGIRHKSVVNGTSTDFVLDGSMFIRELNSGAVKATYFMGASGPAYRRDDVTSAVRWYLYDGLGSVLGEVDPNGTITATRKYDVYGAVRSSTGTSTSKHKFVGSLGHSSEDETGLTYMRARYYDPQAGRFASEDPKGDGGNWYIYAGDNPVNCFDRDGKKLDLVDWTCFGAGCLFALIAFTCAFGAWLDGPYAGKADLIGAEVAGLAAIACFSAALDGVDYPGGITRKFAAYGFLTSTLIIMLGGIASAGKLNLPGATVALAAVFTYGLMCLGCMACDDQFWGIQ